MLEMIQNKTNNKNVIEVPKVDAEKSPEELILDTIKKVAKMSKEDEKKIKTEQPVDKWEQLRKGMNESQVILILGQPSFVDTDFITKWYYPNGRVNFDNDMKLSWWTNK